MAAVGRLKPKDPTELEAVESGRTTTSNCN